MLVEWFCIQGEDIKLGDCKLKVNVNQSRGGRFTPGKEPVPNVQEAGWNIGKFWTCANNFAPPDFF
jgi:hypothetical protein